MRHSHELWIRRSTVWRSLRTGTKDAMELAAKREMAALEESGRGAGLLITKLGDFPSQHSQPLYEVPSMALPRPPR